MDEAVKSSIISACRSGEAKEVQTILRSLEGEPGYEEYCKVAMFEACRVGDVDIVEYLVHTVSDSDSIINSTDENGETPLHIASKLLNVEVCKVIIQTGVCNVNMQSFSGATPLHLAIGAKNDTPEAKLEVTCLLLSLSTCDPHTADSQGVTPLQIVLEYGISNQLFLALLDKGSAQGYAKTEQMIQQALTLTDNELLHLIIERYTGTRIVQAVLRNLNYLPPSVIESEASNLLFTAVKAEDAEAVKVLLKSRYCDPNERTEAGDTPLIIACKLGLSKITDVLLCYKNIDINVQNNEGNTALHCALARRVSGVVFKLVNGTKPNLTNQLGEAPLHTACAHLSMQAVAQLIMRGRCNVNLQTITGQTPLHLVVRAQGGELESKVEIIRLLLAIPDCDPNIRNSDGNTPLILACKPANQLVPNYPVINALIATNRCDPSIKNNDGDTALHFAVVQGSKKAIEVLISCVGYIPDLLNRLSETPLHIACSQLNTQAVTVLLKEGTCDVNAQTNTGQTPLHLVVRKNELEGIYTITKLELRRNIKTLCHILLEVPGCDPLIADAQGATPLQTAYLNDVEVFMCLLEWACAEGYSKTRKMIEQAMELTGNNLLHMVTCYSATTVMRYILKFEDCQDIVNKVKDSSGDTPLIGAIKAESVEAVELLLDSQYCDPNVRSAIDGDTPLIVACKMAGTHRTGGYLQIIHLLLSNEMCDINCQNDKGNTALHIAAAESCQEAVIALVSHERCKLDIVNNQGETPLHLACGAVNVQAVTEILTNENCNINLQTYTGQTPLHLAVGAKYADIKSKVELIQLLLAIPKCNPDIRNSEGDTPLIGACKLVGQNAQVYFEVICAFLPSKCDPHIQNRDGNTALHVAAATDCQGAQAVKVLLYNGRDDFNVANKCGEVPLHIACKYLRKHGVLVFLEVGECDPNVQTITGQTPLHLAVQAEESELESKVEIVQLLLANPDCDPNIRNSDGDTPLILACKLANKQVPNYPVINALISSNKCDPSIKNNDGNTALHFAVVQSSQRAIEVLVNCGSYIPDLLNQLSETPLHIACSQLNLQAVTVLLKEGKCDVNAQTCTGQTPLHLVVDTNEQKLEDNTEIDLKKNVTHLLLEVPHCNIHIADAQGATPLQTAYQKDVEVFICLLEWACAEGYSKTSKMIEQAMELTDNNLLHLLSHFRATKVMRFVLDSQSSSPAIINKVAESSGDTPLIAAIKVECVAAVELLLDSQYCNPEARSAFNGDTPLIVACKMAAIHSRGHYLQIVYLLLSNGMYYINCQNDEGNTALHIAAARNCQEAVIALVGHEIYKPDIINNRGESPLHLACDELNVSSAAAILKGGKCNINLQTNTGQTPLHLVVGAQKVNPGSKLELIQLLLSQDTILGDRQCDPNVKNCCGVAPLHIAVEISSCDISILETLLHNKRCDPNVQDCFYKTPLHIACSQLNIQAVTVLLKEGRCDVNAQTNRGQTPLHTVLISTAQDKDGTSSLTDESAYRYKRNHFHKQDLREKITLLLLEVPHCDPHIANKQGETPLQIAYKTSDLLFTLILEKGCVESYSKTKEVIDQAMILTDNNLFDLLLFQRATTVMRHVLKLQAFLVSVNNIIASSGEPPLIIATKTNYVDAVKLLLDSQYCDPNVRSSADGDTPLIVACKMAVLHYTSGYLEIIHLLLSNSKCNINDQNDEGNTALHIAAAGSCQEAVIALVDHKRYKPDIVNHQGETPLHLACGALDVSGVTVVLRDSRCNVNLQTNNGQTPLHLVIKAQESKIGSKVELINLLLSNPDHIDSDMSTQDTILGDRQCDPNIRNCSGEAPLHIAVEISSCDISILLTLVHNKQCDHNVQNGFGRTPLHIACSQLNIQAVTVLLKEGRCDVNAQTSTGQTPLHLVIAAKRKRELESSRKESIARLLLETPHCDPDIDDAQGVTPIQTAHRANIKVFALILDKASEKGYSKEGQQSLIGQAIRLTRNNLLHMMIRLRKTRNLEHLLKLQTSSAIVNKVEDPSGDTPLIVAIKAEGVEAVELLLSSQYCDPNVRSAIDGDTPLIVACKMTTTRCTEGYLQIMHLLLSSGKCDINSQNDEGNTALHIAAEGSCQKENSRGETPLDLALLPVDGKASKTSTLHNVKSCHAETQLHIAVEANSYNILEALLQNKQLNPNLQNNAGETPLHVACRLRKHDCVIALTRNKRCNTNIPDNDGFTALQKAIYNMDPDDLSIIEHLISDSRCDVSACDLQGNTALHIACTKAAWKQEDSMVSLIRLLLSTGKVDPQCVNNAGETPAQLAMSNKKVYQELSYFSESQLKHPIQTFVKVFVVGNAETGKSTLIEAICTEASKGRKFVPSQFKTVKGVKPHTAGIVPIPVQSRHFGNVIIYDFAGQHEYYSSHAAVLENLVLSSPPVFVVLVDLSKPLEDMSEIIAYWWSFIGSYTARSHLNMPPHVIVVGSHKDVIKARGRVSTITTKVLETLDGLPTNFIRAGFVALNCTLVASQGLTILLSQLKKTCETLRKEEQVDLRCHVLSAFLQDKFPNSMACTLAYVIDSVKSEESTLLPQSTTDLVNLLAILSDKDRILLLRNSVCLEGSWIILQRQELYKKINGSIFAPEYFDEHITDFARSTGVVPLSEIKKYFPQHHPDIITGFLSHLEFCFKIGDTQVLDLIADEEKYSPDEEFYFFPALVQVKSPPKEKVWKTDSEVHSPVNKQPAHKLQYGWFYKCSHPHQYLMTRFLHVLQFRLAFSFALTMEHRPLHNVPTISRRCSVWKQGIAWLNNHGIETVLEVGIQNQWVVLLMQCSAGMEVECAKLRSAAVKIILDTKEEFCPSIGMHESLLHPCNVDYPFQRTNQLTLYRLKEVSRVLVEGNPFAVDEEGSNSIKVSELLPFEPYTGLGDVLLSQLFASEYAQQKITDRSLQELSQRMLIGTGTSVDQLKLLAKALIPQKAIPFLVSQGESPIVQCVNLIQQAGIKTYQDLKEKLSCFSIFCGRNPLILADLSHTVVDALADPEYECLLEQTDDRLLGIESLLEVRTEVVPAVGHSASLGLTLGLSQAPTLQTIQHNWPDDVAFQLTEIMAAWLQGIEYSSWRSLAKALLDPAVDCPAIAHAIMEHHPHHRHFSDLSEDEITYQKVDGTAPDQSFFSEVLSAVVQGGHFSWFHLGLVLGLHYGSLKNIQMERASYRTCVTLVIKKWLDNVDSVEREGQPSWKALARALAHPLVGQQRLAEAVAREHPAHEGTSTSESVSPPEIVETSAESPKFLHPLHPSMFLAPPPIFPRTSSSPFP